MCNLDQFQAILLLILLFISYLILLLFTGIVCPIKALFSLSYPFHQLSHQPQGINSYKVLFSKGCFNVYRGPIKGKATVIMGSEILGKAPAKKINLYRSQSFMLEHFTSEYQNFP